MNRPHLGSDFDDFLQHDGLLAECEAGALKRVVAWQLEREMKRRRISRAKLASRIKTSLATLDRLFAPDRPVKKCRLPPISSPYLLPPRSTACSHQTGQSRNAT